MEEDIVDVLLLEQHLEQLGDVKRELSAIYEELIALDLADDHPLVTQHVKLEKLQFDCSYSVKKLLSLHVSHPSRSAVPASGGNVSKLPKLDVPTFNRDILQWQPFWEQFEVSVHCCTSLTNAEKLSLPAAGHQEWVSLDHDEWSL